MSETQNLTEMVIAIERLQKTVAYFVRESRSFHLRYHALRFSYERCNNKKCRTDRRAVG